MTRPCEVRATLEGRIVYCEDLSWVAPVFRNRWDAGRRLASLLEWLVSENLLEKPQVVYAIPAGGVPIGIEVSHTLRIPLDLVVVKKVTFPWTTEAGFGAVAPDGRPVVDESVVRQLGEDTVERQVEVARKKVKERLERLRGDATYARLDGATVVVVDDGIAAGWTMIAAVRFLRGLGASRIYAAAPTSSTDGAERVASYADKVIVVNLRTGIPYFAVADAYVEWRDLSDEEVAEMLRRYGWSPYTPRGG